MNEWKGQGTVWRKNNWYQINSKILLQISFKIVVYYYETATVPIPIKCHNCQINVHSKIASYQIYIASYQCTTLEVP